MDQLKKDIHKMFDEIKKPSEKTTYVYERNGGTIYRRPVGGDVSTREIVAQSVTKEKKNDRI